MHDMRRTAVLLDEHPMWLSALERVLEDVGFEPIAKVKSPVEALEVIKTERPDLFLIDIDTNGSQPDGLTCLREASELAPQMKAVVVSGCEDPGKIDAALAAGAVVYVLKRAEPGDLASAIRQVFTRSLYLAGSPGQSSRPALSSETATAGLTRREREILQLVAEGMTNGGVARKLWVTEQTVKFHLANIFRKLNVTNRTQASRWAHSHGLFAEAEDDAPEALERELIPAR
jgi:two-component system, NarL family, response regulator DegU